MKPQEIGSLRIISICFYHGGRHEKEGTENVNEDALCIVHITIESAGYLKFPGPGQVYSRTIWEQEKKLQEPWLRCLQHH